MSFSLFVSVTTLVFWLHSHICASDSGFDFADAVFTESDYECLIDRGYTYMIVRAWESIGSFDYDSPANLKNAQSAGFAVSNTSVYMFPCASTAESAAKQMQTMIDNLKDYDYDMVWLDIEENPSSGCSWSENDIDTNCDIIIALGNTTIQNGKQVGVYSNYNEWTSYVFFDDSGACSQPAKYGWPLWYADYDDEDNFDDFVAFGGWSEPVIKQTAGDATVCGLDIDINWRP